jgi:hypothetical protein
MRLLDVDPGFRVERFVSATFVLPSSGYRENARIVDFYQRFTDQMRAIPGVEAVGMTSKMPLDFGNSVGFAIAGQPAPDPARMPSASYRQVNTDLLQRRWVFRRSRARIRARRIRGAPQTAVVNRALADAYFANQNAIGQGLLFGSRHDSHRSASWATCRSATSATRFQPTLYIAVRANAADVDGDRRSHEPRRRSVSRARLGKRSARLEPSAAISAADVDGDGDHGIAVRVHEAIPAVSGSERSPSPRWCWRSSGSTAW